MDQLGDYRLLEELAEGTTGRVFAASRWPALGGRHLMAIKLINGVLSRNERFLALLREGVARLSGFEHPGIVPILELTSAADQLVLASELVDGQPLDQVIHHWGAQDGRLDPMLPLWMMQKVASVLTVAHGSGLVHGHLAPDQIVITYHGEVRLLGLGRGEARGALPLHDVRRPFLAPEVLRTGVSSPASDVHGLARILHHTLAGPNSVLSTPGIDAPAWLPPLRSYGFAIHPAVEALIDAMLSASPNGRPSLEEVESALASTVSSRGPMLRNQLSRIMQTVFTTEFAGANLRHKRVSRGPDEVDINDDLIMPQPQRRTIVSEETGRFNLPEISGPVTDPALTPSTPPLVPVVHAATHDLVATEPRAAVTGYGWTETASLEDLSSNDVFNGVHASQRPPPSSATG